QVEFLIEDLRVCLPDLSPGFDLIFHDPFSPQKAPELWSVDLFRQYYRLLARPHGRILTYSAAGAVRGGLQEAGLAVGRTAGVAAKSGGRIGGFEAALADSLSDEERAFIASRAGIPYRDADLRQSRENIRANRLAEQQQSSRPSAEALRKRLS